MKRVIVVNNFLQDPDAEARQAQEAQYHDEFHRGLNYPGISVSPDPAAEDRIRNILGVHGGAFTTFHRRYLPTEKQGTFIHNDVEIGAFSGILFLTPPAHCNGGVAFWRHRLYGWECQPLLEELAPRGLRDTPELWKSVLDDGLDEFKWEMVDYVPMEFNRLILFLSRRFHSRYPKDPIGTGPENCRVIKTFFYWPEAQGPDGGAT